MKYIYKKPYYVLDDEFSQGSHKDYNNLIFINELAESERIIGLINILQYIFNIENFVCLNSTHGGYIPLHCYSNFKNNIIKTNNYDHYDNIKKNFDEYNKNDNNLNKINIIYENKNEEQHNNNNNNNSNTIIYSENEINDYDFDNYCKQNPIILINSCVKDTKINIENIEKKYKKENKFILYGLNLIIYIPDIHIDIFNKEFEYYFFKDKPIDINNDNNDNNDNDDNNDTNDNNDNNILDYDNLINLCIMVKNGGPQFEEMLKANYHLIDHWTILDTGSTDNTIEIINKLLVGKKKGNLYCEPFINFRDSRNRLLDLAGNICKYTLMLDDTYIIRGDLREFLNVVRSDQFSDSFSLYIQSDDVEYGSNRILRSDTKLRYLFKIHEVIDPLNNNNVIIPKNAAFIEDGRYDYMNERTMERKKLDLRLLQEEIDDDPENPRSYYYMGQTYSLLKEHQLAFDYFIKRMNCKREGFLQEKIDAVFEAARLANFQLNKPWEECEILYKKAYELDKSRPDSLYFLGIHYFLENNKEVAFDYFKEAFRVGYPAHCQYSLKPTLSFHFLPRYLTQLCYEFQDFKLGEECALLFLKNNKPDAEYYSVILSWYQIFIHLNKLNKNPDNKFEEIDLRNKNKKPYLIFVADGGFNKWSGSTILKKGVGGSETYIIEMAKYIQKHGYFQVIVFCNCECEETFNEVEYLHLSMYHDFISNKNVNTCIISRYSEYYPAAIHSNVSNIYLIAHDLSFTGIVIPIHKNLRKIFCLSEWHVKYISEIFPQLKDYFVPFYYGIDFNNFISNNIILKEKNKFIYSSFPNRGLLELLHMWPKINLKYPDASLHIFCDLDNKWANNYHGDKIKEIRMLLEQYNSVYNVVNHGWVNKKTLAEAWLSSEYWFYPCTFPETFCLTALEAALTKTLAISNNNAALENTIADRGVIIEGEPSKPEWQNKALKELFKIMEDDNKKEKLIQKNYRWAINLSWEKQANKLLNEYLLLHK